MSEYLIQKETLTSIADAIRSKTGESGEIKLTDFSTKIQNITSGGSGVGKLGGMLLATKNGKYYPDQSVCFDTIYPFKASYTQEFLAPLYEEASAVYEFSMNDFTTGAFLIDNNDANMNGVAVIRFMLGANIYYYGLMKECPEPKFWVPVEVATALGYTAEGWYSIVDANTMAFAPSDIPDYPLMGSATCVIENIEGIFELFDPSGFVGFSSVKVDISTSGGENSNKDEFKLHEEKWLDDVCFWDLEGNLLKNIPMSEIQSFTEADFPTAPTYDGLTFQCWNHSIDDIHTTEYPLDIAPIYSTTDGRTHIKLKPYGTNYRDFQFNFTQTVSNGVIFDFGDGTAPQTVSGTGAVYIQHTYSVVQEYEIVIDVVEGCIFGLGSNTQTTGFVCKKAGTSYNSSYANAITDCRIADNVNINYYAFYNCSYMTFLSLPKTLTTIEKYVFSNCYRVKFISIPNGVETIQQNALYTVGSNIVAHQMVFSLPQTVISIEKSALSSVRTQRRVIIPKMVTEIKDHVLMDLNSIRRIFLPSNNITSIGTYFLHGCYCIRNFEIPPMITDIKSRFMPSCVSDYVKIPSGVATIDNPFSNSYIKTLYIPSTITTFNLSSSTSGGIFDTIIYEDASKITTISNSWVSLNVKYIIFLNSTPPTTTIINKIVYDSYTPTVFVPDDAIEAYKTALSSKYVQILPLSEYNGTLPDFN